MWEPINQLSSKSGRQFGLGHLLDEVSIIHTNDLHNNIESLQTGKKSGYGGLRNISASLAQIETSFLLLDAGDFLDDKASMEDHKRMIRSMNQLGFRAATIGNRELSNGVEHLASLMPLMKFSLVNCNYTFDDPYLCNNIHSYKILRSGRFKIGLTGVGTNQSIPTSGISWQHPYDKANSFARFMKEQKGCDLVICLSHLGYKQPSGNPANEEFAKASENIDLIIGGHSELIMPYQMILRNKLKHEVIVSHGGPGGILVKQVTFGFNGQQRNRLAFKNFVPGSVAGSSGYDEIRRIMR